MDGGFILDLNLSSSRSLKIPLKCKKETEEDFVERK